MTDDREYRREDDARLARIETGVESLTRMVTDFMISQENRMTKIETNSKWVGVIAGLVATFLSSVLLLFVTAWMRR